MKKGFTLIETLIVVAIISLLMSILLPGLTEAKKQAQSIKCQANLKEFSNFAHLNAQQDSKSRLHTPHPACDEDADIRNYPDTVAKWMGSGDYDWGGNDGADGEYSKTQPLRYTPSNTTQNNRSPKGANGRFINKIMFGSDRMDSKGIQALNLFKENGDDGLISKSQMTQPARQGLFNADTNTTIASNVNALSAMWQNNIFGAAGNSYVAGQYYFFKDHSRDNLIGGGTYVRWDSYRRPIDRFTTMSKVLMFYESRVTQAIANVKELGPTNLGIQIPAQSGYFGQYPQTIMGHHGKPGYFNAGFADGHGARIRINAIGTINNPRDYRQLNGTSINGYWRAMWRSESWQFDNYPQKTIERGWFYDWNIADNPRSIYVNNIFE